MAPLFRPGFWFFSLLSAGLLGLALAGCPSSDDDDDDSGEGEGEGEGECEPRVCNDPGEQCCGPDCVNTNTSFSDCGGCDAPCNGDISASCVDGECRCGTNPACAEGSELCCGRDKACIDPTSDPNFCGNCNTTCIGVTAEKQSDRCIDSVCVCGDTGEACAGTLSETCCPGDPDDGGGAECQNIQTDVNNCGGCSFGDRDEDETHIRGDGILDTHHQCDPLMSNICRLASCVCGIPEDIGIDPAPCLGTRASTCCAPANPADADLAVCANLDNDEAHCGQCNNPCAQGDECTAGICG